MGLDYPLSELPTPDANGDFTLKLANGATVPQIDPVTRQPTGEAQKFRYAGAHVADEMERPQPLRAADMSSTQRNALLDEMVGVVNANALAMRELRTRIDAERSHRLELAKDQRSYVDSVERNLQRQQGATFNSLAEFCNRPFMARLRWLVTGR